MSNKVVYIDDEYKCHAANQDGNYREVDGYFFEGKCDAYIEGFRYIPFGENWTNDDGHVIHGRAIIAWSPYNELDEVQRVYERQLIDEYAEALSVLGVEV